jgi:hypothetical protein
MGVRRLGFALSLAIFTAPVAADVCQAICAQHAHNPDASDPPTHGHRSGCEKQRHEAQHRSPESSEQTTSTFEATSPPCGHIAVAVPAAQKPLRAETELAVPLVAAAVPRLERRPRSNNVDARHGPPVSLRIASPKRI